MLHQGKKNTQKPTEEELIKSQKLAKEIEAGLQKFLSIRNQEKTVQQFDNLLSFNNLMISLCPDMATLYNYRQELINLHSGQEKLTILQKEIQFLNGILKKIPKSYTVWSYRQFCIYESFNLEKQLNIQENRLYMQDLMLCGMMLMKDDRNFHVWNYRNWLISLDDNLIKKELQFTKEKIENNCNNFSAYYFRQKNLLKFYKCLDLSFIREECEFIQTGFFIDCKDVGIWQYHSWLLQSLIPVQLISFKKDENNKDSIDLFFSQQVKQIQFSDENGEQIKVENSKQYSNHFSINIKDFQKIQCKKQTLETLINHQEIQPFSIDLLTNEIIYENLEENLKILKEQENLVNELHELEPENSHILNQTILIHDIYSDQHIIDKNLEQAKIFNQKIISLYKSLQETKKVMYTIKLEKYSRLQKSLEETKDFDLLQKRSILQ